MLENLTFEDKQSIARYIAEQFKEAGYDGILIDDTGEMDEIIILDAKKAKIINWETIGDQPEQQLDPSKETSTSL